LNNLGPVSDGTHIGNRFNVINQIKSSTLQEMATTSLLPLTSFIAAGFFLQPGQRPALAHRLLHWGNYPLIARVLRYDGS
jgi:hypothetical protein